MAHKRKDKDKKKEHHTPSRKDTSHRKELRDYERKRGKIVLLSVSVALVLAILIVPTVLFLGTPWTGPVVGGDGSSIIDLGKPAKTDLEDIDVVDDDDDVPPIGDNPRVTINVQSYGSIVLELDADKAPISVSNFIQYAQEGYYDGLIFHRVIEGFMVQGGGFFPDMNEKNPPYPPIKNEAIDSGLLNDRGTISMARTNSPDSATSQFFINTVDNAFLDPGGNSAEGYAVFGRVISGMSVVDTIESVSTTTENGQENVPVSDVIITTVTVQG